MIATRPGRLSVMVLVIGMISGQISASELGEQIRPLIEAHAGDVAVFVKNLKTGETFAHQADRPMSSASLIKFPLMVAAYQAVADGRLQLDQMVTIREEDKVPGSPITSLLSAGATITLRDAIHLMIIHSDNTATNLVIDQVGLPETTALMMRLGLPETRLHSKTYRRDTSIAPERSQTFGLGSTTAAEAARLFERLSERQLVSTEASDRMLEHLFACEDKLKFRRFLPREKIAHKTGSIASARCDAGLIESSAGRLVICVMTGNNKDQSFGESNQADILCGRIAECAFRFFNPSSQATTTAEAGPLRKGSTGPLVATLQRTLNAVAQLDPALPTTGQFGPLTEAAVRRFQESRGLTVDGIVTAETWAALGPIVEGTSPASVPGLPDRKPNDPLSDRPFVTCKAWAICEAATGRVLWHHQGNDRRDIASTTKVMTAFLVIRYAAQHPEVLDETVQFSTRADLTNGSTADVRAGERLTVRELLYGLLLPSGNDASVALAEHFGDRVAPEVSDDDPTKSSLSSYQKFIAAMNHAATELHMTKTSYVNPHGLSVEGHLSSACDLLILARHALELPLFQEIVNTRQYECVATGPSGYLRRIVWKNTNQLLDREGYSGVKTGTTQPAGACLVSCGTHDGCALLVAVLGSTSADARYTDTLNLYRWAWLQLQTKSGNTP